MKINREAFLHALHLIEPGTTTNQSVAQSNCFIFSENHIYAFNDEITCIVKMEVDFHCAVPAKPLLAVLNKYTDEIVDVSMDDDKLVIKAGRKRTQLNIEAEVLIPLGITGLPKKWVPMHPEFEEAVGIVRSCAATKSDRFALTCLHITPSYIQSCDTRQACKATMETGAKGETLIRAASIKNIVGMGMTEWGATKAWLFFKAPTGLIMGIRRWADEYPNIEQVYELTNPQQFCLPNSIPEILDRTTIFANEQGIEPVIKMIVTENQIEFKGESSNGSHQERVAINYGGEPFSFNISPKVLIQAVKNSNEAVLSQDRLSVEFGRFTYVASIGG